MRQTSLPPRLDYSASSPTNDTSASPALECNSDLVMSSDGDAPPAPPPRIAARLHRPSSKRQSASSSRRNSISSMQSAGNMSNTSRSGFGRTQNHHVAQHLRRVSILEDRKAKLAERNAHAELVRMRAQQAKAASRWSSKLREERTIAAQQARERHLAQVAANCAEEVKRAKKIAEETREKKAAENLKLREEMEEKIEDARRRRRQQLQQSQGQIRRMTRTNGGSLPAVEEKMVAVDPWRPKSQVLAARIVQNAWRNCVRRRAVADFVALNLDVESLQAQSFEAVTALVADTKVLSATKNLLKLCGLLDENEDESNTDACVRIFLCSYVTLSHPKQILSKSGDLEEELIGHAKKLLMQFQRLLSKPPTEKTFLPTSELMISLTEAYHNFQQAFEDWKSRDASFIIDGAIAQFVELDAIWQTVKNDTTGGVADDYKEGIKNNQALILARLKRLLGPDRAFKMISDAVKARRKAKAKGKPTGDVKPRMATQSPGGSDAASSTTLPPPPTSAEPSLQLHSAPRPGTSSQLNALNSTSRVLPENRVLVHELAINKDYRIDVDHAAEDKQTAYRQVFNAMRLDIETGNGDPWIMSMAEWIKERLLRLVKPGKSFHAMIVEYLDPKTISSQLRMRSFSYEKFFSFMNSILPKLCAPIRDNEVKALVTDQSSDFIERLAKLMHVIELLALDHANYLLSQSAPELIRQAPQYEQKCFHEFLANKGLDRALKWWRQARAHTVADMARRSPEGTPPKPPSSTKIYTNGLVDLFVGLPPSSSRQPVVIPETLALDAKRIATSRSDVLRIITVSSILLTAKNLLKRDVRSQWRTQAQRMWDLSGSPAAFADPAPYLQILDSTSGAALPPAKRQSLAGTVETLLANARQSSNVSHPVMKVLLRKIREHALARLAASSSEEKVRAATSAAEVLGAGGMAEFVGRIGVLVDEMARVRQVDWDAHGKWIDQVAEQVERENANL